MRAIRSTIASLPVLAKELQTETYGFCIEPDIELECQEAEKQGFCKAPWPTCPCGRIVSSESQNPASRRQSEAFEQDSLSLADGLERMALGPGRADEDPVADLGSEETVIIELIHESQLGVLKHYSN
ncbi:hypothetical protein MMC15_008038 [Xylographa vitiligo]|nr:hypothetical protein [Xylographa vitiligo]